MSSTPDPSAAQALTDGERWTRTELAELRRGGWRPRSLLAFLRVAQARANETRRRRPGLARQECVWGLVGAAGWELTARLRPDGPFAHARARGLVWWGGCALMLDWHLGMLQTPDGREVGLGLADALTLMRAWLVPALPHGAAPGLLALGALTDVADGAVARATRGTRFGRDLEGLVDACFFAAALRGAVRCGGLSPLPAMLERARLAGGAGYATAMYFGAGRPPDPVVSASGRRAAPVRTAALLAAGLGRRRLADSLLVAGGGISVAGVLRERFTGCPR